MTRPPRPTAPRFTANRKFFDDLYPGLKKAVESTLYQYYQGQLQGSGANETSRTPSSMLTTGEEQVSSVTAASIQTQTLPPGRWSSTAAKSSVWEKMCTVAHGLLIFNELIRRAEEPPD